MSTSSKYLDFVYSIELSYLWMELYRMSHSKALQGAKREKLMWVIDKVEKSQEKALKCEIALLDQSAKIKLLQEREKMMIRDIKMLCEQQLSQQQITELANQYFEKK